MTKQEQNKGLVFGFLFLIFCVGIALGIAITGIIFNGSYYQNDCNSTFINETIKQSYDSGFNDAIKSLSPLCETINVTEDNFIVRCRK